MGRDALQGATPAHAHTDRNTGMKPWLDTPEGPAHLHRLDNGQLQLDVSEWGATLVALRVPDRLGHRQDVLLGHRDAGTYLDNPGHLGCIVGRVANRIDGARATIDGRECSFEANLPGITLHGGPGGFHARLWHGETTDTVVHLHRTSPAGEGGFPGRLDVRVTYALLGSSVELVIEARSDAPTLVNLAQHAYFNLAGHAGGRIDEHELQLGTCAVLAVDDRLIPTGAIVAADGALALAARTRLGDHLAPLATELVPTLGYDHCFVLDRRPAAELWHPPSGRRLTLTTDQPALQVYSAGHMQRVPGKDGAFYDAHHGLALETQAFPNAPNTPAFPSILLMPGEVYRRSTRYAFSLDD